MSAAAVLVARTATVSCMAARGKADPVGVLEIASRLGVKDRTVHQWQFRQIMPPPDYASINGGKAWEWKTILKWAGVTGHVFSQTAKDEYEREFKSEPRVPKPGRKTDL